jgi:hypothetical protein
MWCPIISAQRFLYHRRIEQHVVKSELKKVKRKGRKRQRKLQRPTKKERRIIKAR